MEAKTLPIKTTETIAMTEKKMDMSLDEIIKMSKKKSSKGERSLRRPVKSQGFRNGNVSKGSSRFSNIWVQNHQLDSPQGVLVQRRSSFSGNQFPVTKEAAKKAAAMPISNRVINFNKTR